MASSGNFSTMNNFHRTSTSVVYTNGNLTFSPGSSWSETTFTRNNMVIPKDKKIYLEVHCDAQSGDYHMFGFSAVRSGPTSSQSGSTGTIMIYNGSTRINGTRTDGVVSNPSQGQIVGMAIDGSNNKVWFAINNTWQISGDPANGTNEIGTITTNSTVGFDITCSFNQNSASSLTANFGQDSTFAGQKTSGSANAADENGFGDFYYTPPTGFLALCSGNLSVNANIDPAQTDDNYPGKQFGAESFTGNAGTQTIQLGDGFKPDCVWMKNRGTANSWIALDSTRGYNKTLKTETSDAEQSNAYVGYGIESDFFDSTGIKANSGGSPGFNASGNDYIVYGWRANGGTTSTNNDGSTTSTVQANTAAGFSIISYTGNGSNRTIGHGLDSAPEFMIIKNRDSSDNWIVYHVDEGAANRSQLNTGVGYGSSSTSFQSTAPSNSIITLGTSSGTNASGDEYICYAWHSVEGYCKVSTFSGTGYGDGAFVNTGFRPRLVMVKRGDNSNYFYMLDSARNPFNGPGWNLITPTTNQSESDHGTSNKIAFFSNGFKMFTSGNGLNGSGGDMTYIAWADVPLKYNNGFK